MPTLEKTTHVLSYTKARYTLFPCGQPGKPKAPRKGWQKTRFRADLKDSDLPPVYGVLLRDDDMILDVDPRRFAAGDNEIARLWAELKLPHPIETFVVGTAGGGLHMYFKKPPGTNVVRSLAKKGYPGIEVKSLGQLVVGCGSEIEGRSYTATRNSPVQVMACPEALLEFCRRVNYTDIEDMDPIEEEDEGAIRRYKLFLSAQPGARMGAGSNNATFVVAAEGKDYGLGPDTVASLMLAEWNPKCTPEWPEAKLRTVVANAFAYGQTAQGRLHPANDFKEFVPAKRNVRSGEAILVNGKPYKVLWDIDIIKGEKRLRGTITNAINFFVMPELGDNPNPLVGLLRYNLFSNKIEFSRPAPWHDVTQKAGHWNDADSVMLRLFLAKECHFHLGTDILESTIVAVAQLYKYHPLRDWLEGLTWDGKPRIDLLLPDYCQSANTPYTREIGKNTLIALVARIFNPGCQHDHMLVLEGEQGTGKSSFCRILGGQFYADFHVDPNKKDTVEAMQGVWIVEVSEMNATRKADADALKSFLTRTTDRIRLSYGRHTKDFPRQCGFIGTVNPEAGGGYLRDTTGNRRFWPVGTGKIDIIRTYRDRDQLFAEAVHRFRQNEKFHIVDPTIAVMAQGEQSKRLTQDEWVFIIESWLRYNEDSEVLERMGGLRNSSIGYCALNIPTSRLGPVEQRRITFAMTSLGYVMDEKSKRWVEDITAGI